MCEKQRDRQAVVALLNGQKFNFRLPQLTPNEVRIAFAGDSVTLGAFGNSWEDVISNSNETRLTDQFDGTS